MDVLARCECCEVIKREKRVEEVITIEPHLRVLLDVEQIGRNSASPDTAEAANARSSALDSKSFGHGPMFLLS